MSSFVCFLFVCLSLFLGVTGAGSDRDIPEFRLLYPADGKVLFPTDHIAFRWSTLSPDKDHIRAKAIQIQQPNGIADECKFEGEDTKNNSAFFTCLYKNADMRYWDYLDWSILSDSKYTARVFFVHPPAISNVSFRFAGLKPYVNVTFSSFGNADERLNRKNLILRFWNSLKEYGFGNLLAEQKYDLESVKNQDSFLVVSETDVNVSTLMSLRIEACIDDVCISNTTGFISSPNNPWAEQKFSVSLVASNDGKKEFVFDDNANREFTYIAYFYSDLADLPYIVHIPRNDTSLLVPEQYQYGTFYLRVVGVNDDHFASTPTYVFKILESSPPGTPTLISNGADFIRSSRDHLFQWSLDSWGTSNESTLVEFNVLIKKGGKINKTTTTSTFISVNLGDTDEPIELTVSPRKNSIDSAMLNTGSLTKEFKVCRFESFKNKKVENVTYNKTSEELTWDFDGDVSKFCNIYGLWGFRVILDNNEYSNSAEFIVTDETKLRIPKDHFFYGTWNARVELFIAGDFVNSSETSNVYEGTRQVSDDCLKKSPALLNSFEVARSKDSVFYPKPVVLRWDTQSFRNKCDFENTIVYVNGKPLAQLADGVTGFTVPSHMLNPDATKFTFQVITRSIAQDTNTSLITIPIKDFIVVPPVVLDSPRLGSEQQSDELTFSWIIPGEYPLPSQNFTYALFIGDSPKTMKQIGGLTTDKSIKISKDLIPFTGGIYWTVKIMNLSEEEATFAAPALSFLRFSGAEIKDPEIKVSFGTPSDPVTFFWNYNPFKISFAGGKSNDYVDLGNYEISISCVESGFVSTVTLAGYSNTVTFYNLSNCENHFTYKFIVINGEENRTFEGKLIFRDRETTSFDLSVEEATGTAIVPFTINWTIPNDGWGCNCTSGLCRTRIFVSAANETSWRYIDTIPFDETLNGEYSYTLGLDQMHTMPHFKYAVVADNGYAVNYTINKFDSGICVPSKPLMPIIFSPEPVALNQPRDARFCVYPLFDFNDCNPPNQEGFYQLWIRDSATREQSIVDVPWSEIDYLENGAICIEHYVNFSIWDWTVAAVNKYGMVSDMDSYSIYDACEPENPGTPVWDIGPNFTFSPYYIPLFWHFENISNGNVFGHYCMSENGLHEMKTVYVYYTNDDDQFYSFDEAKFMTGGKLGSYNFREPGSLSGVDLEHNDEALLAGFDVHFMIAISNGARTVYSKVLTGFSRNDTCENLECSSKGGLCNKTIAACTCYPHFGGSRCQIDYDRRKRVIIAVAVSVSAFVLLAVAAVVVFIVVRKYYKTHKALMMKRPEFESLRTPPMKMPVFPPELDVNIDYDIVERAVFGENGLVMLWDILKNTSSTEIDGMAKALVYSFQKQNKALELMAFLIICEITESTSTTVLFRANSPATRAFKYYSKMYALEYLYKTLAVLLQGIIRDVDDMEEEDVENGNATAMEEMNEDVDDEDDISSDENIGFLKIQLMSQKFFVQINRSDKACPGEIKHICACLQTQLAARYPDFVYQGIGAFVFLRFYNTAITVPESYGLLPEAPRPSVRKQLLAVTKVLQNLANGVLFGDKEQNMVKLNGFITSQRPAYEAFIQKLCDASAPLSDPVPITDESYKASLATIVNQLFVISKSDDTMLDRLQGITDELRDHIRKMKASKKEQPQE